MFPSTSKPNIKKPEIPSLDLGTVTPITPRSQDLRSGRPRNDGAIEVSSRPMSARVPYIGDMPQLPQLPALPVLPTRLGSRQRIEFSNSENVDENIPPPDEDEGELIIETPPRSPKGKERDVIVRNSASASLPISVKNEPPPKPVEVFAVRNPIVNKAIKAEKTLFADKYSPRAC
jgi:hypothetical protein